MQAIYNDLTDVYSRKVFVTGLCLPEQPLVLVLDMISGSRLVFPPRFHSDLFSSTDYVYKEAGTAARGTHAIDGRHDLEWFGVVYARMYIPPLERKSPWRKIVNLLAVANCTTE